jgi:hypothetical protein
MVIMAQNMTQDPNRHNCPPDNSDCVECSVVSEGRHVERGELTRVPQLVLLDFIPWLVLSTMELNHSDGD